MRKALRAASTLATRRLTIVCDLIPYRFERVPYPKLLNWLLVEASIFFKPARPWGTPTHLMVEPTAFCNLSCALCPVTAGLGRPQGHMSLDTFRALVDEVGDKVFLMLLWDWGEPFLNPSIFDMIAHAKARGIRVVSSTNGHLLADPRKAELLVRSGIDTIIFAIDGITPETYVRFRQGGNLDRALAGVRAVAAAKRELVSATPLINFRFIVTGQNEHEVERLPAFARELGADVLTYKTLNPYSSDPYAGSVSERAPDASVIPRNPRWRRFSEPAGERIRLKRNPCKNLWNHPSIHWSGVVTPCTYDPREICPLGDLKRQSFREIWRGEAYRAMRLRFRRDSGSIDFCRECSYAYLGGCCIDETIAEALFFNRDAAGPTTMEAKP